MRTTTQVIDDGDGQIVLIPSEFAFSAEAVRIRREGDAVILEPLAKDGNRTSAMDSNDRYIILLGLVVIGGAIWVQFGIGNESWTNWMMAGIGAILIAWRLINWCRNHDR